MARLTWQNVAAPDIGTAMSGYRAASGMIGEAMRGIQDSFANFQATRDQEANSSVLADALRYTDPKSLNEALASGSLFGGVSPNRLSADTLAALANRQGDLIVNQGRQQANDQNQYTHDRARTQHAASDAARGALASVLSTGARGGDIASAYAQNAELLNQLSPEEIQNVFSSGSNLVSNRVNQDSGRQRMRHAAAAEGRASQNHANTLSDREATNRASQYIPAVLSMANNPQALRQFYGGLNESPQVMSILGEYMNKGVPGTFPGTLEAREENRRQAQAVGRAASSSARTGSSNNDRPTDAESDLNAFSNLTNFTTNRSNATPARSSAELISRAINEPPRWVDEVANDIVKNVPGLNFPDVSKTLRDIMDSSNLDANAAGAIFRDSLVSSSTPMTDAGRADPVLGAKLPGTDLSISDLFVLPNMIGDFLGGTQTRLDPNRFEESLRRFQSQDGNTPEVLIHSATRNLTKAQGEQLINAYARLERAKQNSDTAYSRPGSTREFLDSIDQEMRSSGISFSERNEIMKQLRQDHPSTQR